MRRLCTSLLFALVIYPLAASPLATARQWSSRDGNYKLEADLVAFNDTTIVLKRENGDLVGVERNELSDADQAFVGSDDTSSAIKKSAEQMQTWTSADGMQVRGRVLAYGRSTMKVNRKLGKVYINDVAFDQFAPLHQRLVLRILSELENQTLENRKQLQAWAMGLGANVKEHPLQGVLMELESGDKLALPFFLFAQEDLKVLKPGWESWLENEQDSVASQRESLYMQAEAMQYQQQEEHREELRRIEMLKLTMMANATGLIKIWEVGLQPMGGNNWRRTSVIIPAQNSAQASQIAMQNYPGFKIYGIRKVR
ncbi:hypothetical protein CA13_12490 [Planctomycetes bacterium CA13]|uniref:SLA1 homology domain-containing protein n=1 Tax=Novipirellula herctigrandis TaxID=2527986 RepID=A0A5C5YXT7_9BACT|nr:hypothetical protein CA13_12490 [Planctomycetes bacterium CA13]